MPTRDDSGSDRGPARGAAPLKFLLAMAVAGCLIRLAFSFGYWIGQPLTRDEQEYLSLARSLAAGRGFAYDIAFADQAFLPFGRAPGYPAFIALVGGGRDATASVPGTLQAAQAVVGGVGVLLAGILSTRLFGPRSGRLGALLAAVYPPLVWISGYALSEAIFWPIGLACAWLYDRVWWREGHTGRLALACGLATGAAMLVRPSVILFVPIAVAALAVQRRWMSAGAIALGVLLVVGPWTFRNYGVHGRLILVASDGGVTFWSGNNSLATGEGDMAANPAIKRADRQLRADHPGLTEEQMEPIYYREAWQWIRQHPGQFLVLELKKLFYTVVPLGPSYRLHSARYFAASVVSYVALASLALVVVWRHARMVPRTPGIFFLRRVVAAHQSDLLPAGTFPDPDCRSDAGGARVGRGDGAEARRQLIGLADAPRRRHGHELVSPLSG